MIVVVLLVVLLLIVLYMSRNTQKPVVYGSMECGYTVKLRNTIGDHDFVDCTKQECPQFVTGYPTTVYPDGTIKVGI